MAQLGPWAGGKYGFLLVLGTSNIAEGLRGYFTKYDCSSADINPIGGINKTDLRSFLSYWAKESDHPVFEEIAQAVPTAELKPNKEGQKEQTDEDDMGMSYEELDVFGKLRKIDRCGPLSMFEKLVVKWDHLTPRIVSEKVKRFFLYYAINRHKATVLTPSYHAESYGVCDNRFDMRQFLYDTTWEAQNAEIDELLIVLEKANPEQKQKQMM